MFNEKSQLPNEVPMRSIQDAMRLVAFKAPLNQGMTTTSRNKTQPTRRRQEFTYLNNS